MVRGDPATDTAPPLCTHWCARLSRPRSTSRAPFAPLRDTPVPARTSAQPCCARSPVCWRPRRRTARTVVLRMCVCSRLPAGCGVGRGAGASRTAPARGVVPREGGWCARGRCVGAHYAGRSCAGCPGLRMRRYGKVRVHCGWMACIPSMLFAWYVWLDLVLRRYGPM
jgi:hypothetical protein